MEKTLKRILYIEDEEDIREIAKISLEDLGGFEVKYCASGHEAISVAEAFHPDLFLLDVMMPNLDGPATLKELKKINSLRNIPAIFMTAKIRESEVGDYLSCGAIGVIAKPFNPMTLSDSIRIFWNKWYEK